MGLSFFLRFSAHGQLVVPFRLLYNMQALVKALATSRLTDISLYNSYASCFHDGADTN